MRGRTYCTSGTHICTGIKKNFFNYYYLLFYFHEFNICVGVVRCEQSYACVRYAMDKYVNSGEIFQVSKDKSEIITNTI